MADDPIVGHKTLDDGTHLPLRKSEADEIWARAEANKAMRADSMPDDQTAMETLFAAYLRLKELGWRDIIYCPKDGTVFEAISAGSTGVHPCYYDGEWPDGRWWTMEAGDLWPSRPILFRPVDETAQPRQPNDQT